MGRSPWEDAFWAKMWKGELPKWTSRGQAFQTEERAGAKGLRQEWVQRTARKSEGGGWWMSKWLRGKESENTGRDLEILGKSRDVLLSVMGSHWRVSSWGVKKSDLHFTWRSSWQLYWAWTIQGDGRGGRVTSEEACAATWQRWPTEISHWHKCNSSKRSIILCNALCDSEQRLWHRLPGFTTSELSDLFLLT